MEHHDREEREPVSHSIQITETASITISGETTVAAGTHLLLHWADIAVEQERYAMYARRALFRARHYGEDFDLARELRPALIAIAASAHALDALFGELQDLVVPSVRRRWQQNRTSRRARVLETTKFATRANAQRWAHEFAWMFDDARDPAVHPVMVMSPPLEHPLGVNVAGAYLVYSAESATRAVDLLLSILEDCVHSPKPAAAVWAAEMRSSLERLVASRDSTSGSLPRFAPASPV